MFAQNLRFLRDRFSLTQDAAAKQVGVGRSTLIDYEKGKSEPNISILKRFATLFKCTIDELVNSDLTSNGPKQLKIFPEKVRIVAVTLDESRNENIEFVPITAAAGYLTGYSNQDFIRNLFHFSLPKHPVGTFRAFEIKGDSMPPISNGFIVIGKYVEDWTQIKSQKRYVLVLKDEGIVFKKVINRVEDDEQLILISDNPEYEPFTVHINSLLEAWELHSFVGYPNGLYNTSNPILDKLNSIENKIAKFSFHGNEEQ